MDKKLNSLTDINAARRKRISELEIGQLYAYGNHKHVIVMFLGIEQNPGILKPACVKILLNEKIHLVYPEAMYDL